MLRQVDAIVYDLEILAAVPSPIEPNLEGITYCEGWHDKQKMGVSVLCAVDMVTGMPRVFCGDNLKEFPIYAKTRAHLIGFNSIQFDDAVLEAQGIHVRTTFDLLQAIRDEVGRGKGYKLNDLARENLGVEKNMDGALAPVDWQRGNIGKVIDYCMRDVFLTAQLISLLPVITDPNTKRPLLIPVPWPVRTELELLS